MSAGGGGQVPSINVSSLPAWKGPSLALWGTRGRREPLPLGKWLPVPGSISFPPQAAPASLSAAPGLPHPLPRGQGQVHPRWASNLIRPQTQAVGRSFLESGISPPPPICPFGSWQLNDLCNFSTDHGQFVLHFPCEPVQGEAGPRLSLAPGTPSVLGASWPITQRKRPRARSVY